MRRPCHWQGSVLQSRVRIGSDSRSNCCPETGGKFPGDGKGTIIDIGANIGPIAIAMLQLELVDKAIMIEPDPRNFALLQRNVDQNQLTDKVICLP
ncbi:MAG: hypothetical protein CMJ64_18625 [Planctomycetaceae bacterium]|nr:hypothetical protein [Planctomycetaceae bacterium]